MMNLREFQDLLGEHFDGTLSGEQLVAFCRALESDPALQEELRVHQELVALMGRMESPKAPANLRSRVMERLLEEHSRAEIAEIEVMPRPQGFMERLIGRMPRWKLHASLAGAFAAGAVVAGILLIPIFNSPVRQIQQTAAVQPSASPTRVASTIASEAVNAKDAATKSEAATRDAVASAPQPTPDIVPLVEPPAESRVVADNAPAAPAVRQESTQPVQPTERPLPPDLANENSSDSSEQSNLEMAEQAEHNAVAPARIPGAGMPEVAQTPASQMRTVSLADNQPPLMAPGSRRAPQPAPPALQSADNAAAPAMPPAPAPAPASRAKASRLVVASAENQGAAGTAGAGTTAFQPSAFAPHPAAQVPEVSAPIETSAEPRQSVRAPGSPVPTPSEPMAVINVLLRGPFTGSAPAAGVKTTQGLVTVSQVEKELRNQGIDTRRVRVHLDSGRVVEGLACSVSGHDFQWVTLQLARVGIGYAPALNTNPILAPISVADARRKFQMDSAVTGIAFYSRGGFPDMQAPTGGAPISFRIHFEQVSP